MSRVLVKINKKICWIFGHREIENLYNIKDVLLKTLKNLIIKHNVKIFLLGSRSKLYDICFDILNALKQKYSFIKISYIMAEFEYSDKHYKEYLLQFYDIVFFQSVSMGQVGIVT